MADYVMYFRHRTPEAVRYTDDMVSTQRNAGGFNLSLSDFHDLGQPAVIGMRVTSLSPPEGTGPMILDILKLYIEGSRKVRFRSIGDGRIKYFTMIMERWKSLGSPSLIQVELRK